MAERYSSSSDKSANIYELQEYLRYISDYIKGVPKIHPDGIYGPETEAAVRAFQAKFNLPQAGEADLATWTAIVNTYDDLQRIHQIPNKIAGYPIEVPHLKEGDNFEEIYFLQIMLRRIAKIYKNVVSPNLSGVYDATTREAVKDFSRLYGRESDIVDREIWNILTDTYNAFTYNA